MREPLGRYAVFVCPILSGSGMRVKLLEAFAAGIPVVSTPLGAEGLAGKDGEICALAEDPAEFARKIVELFDDPEKARKLACRAREQVVATRDMRVLTERLVESYREVLRVKRQVKLITLFGTASCRYRSSLRCFTTGPAVLVSSPGVEFLGRSKTDHSTIRLLRSTTKKLPLPRPKRADTRAAAAKINVRRMRPSWQALARG